MSFERFSVSIPPRDDVQAPAATRDDRAERARDPRAAEIHKAIDWMEQQPRPDHLSEGAWHILLKDLRTISNQWLDIALCCGWSTLHLFGAPPDGSRRLDLTGLALILKGRPIDSVDENRIIIANRNGPPNTFYRHAPGCSAPFDLSGSVPVWQIIFEPPSW